MSTLRRELFTYRGNLSPTVSRILNPLGILLLLVVWQGIVTIFDVKEMIFPGPLAVAAAIPELFTRYNILGNTAFSIFINVFGFAEALIVSIPLGFIISEIPLVKGMSYRTLLILRFLPITAFFGLFITWFQGGWFMKTQFLAFGVFLYLVPTLVHRSLEVENTKIDVMKTLGASSWSIFRIAVFPDAMARFWADIVTLSAVTWTYIAVAETVNQGQGGGIGAMCYNFGLKSHTDLVFGCLLMILFIGWISDLITTGSGRLLFPWAVKKGRR